MFSSYDDLLAISPNQQNRLPSSAYVPERGHSISTAAHLLQCHSTVTSEKRLCWFPFHTQYCLVTPLTMPYFSFQHLSPTGVNVLIRYQFLVSFTNMKISFLYHQTRLYEKGPAASFFKQRPLFHWDIFPHRGHILYFCLACFPSFSFIVLLMAPSVSPNCVPFTFKWSPPYLPSHNLISFRRPGGKHAIFVWALFSFICCLTKFTEDDIISFFIVK